VHLYRVLKRKFFEFNSFSISPIQEDEIEAIRIWRNKQIDALRQKEPLCKEDQLVYFKNKIWPSLLEDNPNQIIFSFYKNQEHIGYGGLVHISWEDKRGELSFLLNPDYIEDELIYGPYFSAFIELMKIVAFQELGFMKITGETYDIRPFHIQTMENCGFELHGRLPKHSFTGGRFVDSLLHNIINEDFIKENKSETEFGNVLISSSAKKIPLIESVRKAANKINSQILIFGGDMDDSSLSFNFTDGKFIMPRTIDENLSDILSWCQSNNVKFVIPTRDGELEFWARNKAAFRENGIFIMVSELESIQHCIDKLLFSKVCSQLNIPAIPSGLKISDLGVDKFVVKERMGAGSESIGLNLSISQAVEHAKSLSEPIFQPMVEGIEISADAYVTKEGVVKGIITRYRSQVENGESVITETFYNEKVHQILQEGISKLKLYGHVIIQAFIADNGDVSIIECNTRFGGASTLSLAAGLDSFYWFLLESKGFSVEEYYFVPAKRSIKQIRANQDKLVYGSSF